MSSFTEAETSTRKKEGSVPETRDVSEGSAKRNIIRNKSKSGGGGVGKTKGKILDDGSMYEDGAALDLNDPNYDSEVYTYLKVISYIEYY
jgi:hypothetical protein